MKTYSVKEIAKMLEKNPETVRRWIRDGKLKADISSNKEGHVIYESELKDFISKSAPNYAGLAGALFTSSPTLGITTAAIGLLGGILAGHVDSKRVESARILPEVAIELLHNEVSLQETIIDKKIKEIEDLKEDIKATEQKIQQLKLIIKQAEENIEE